MDNKKVAFIAIFIFGLALFLLASNIFGDDVTTDSSTGFSDEGATNIGAWYDEAWQASNYYRLKLDTGSTATSLIYKYETVTDPTTSPNVATFTGSDGTGTSASIPQDVVITEWKATGHVHFPSNL